jgi:uncharacterized protein YqeY
VDLLQRLLDDQKMAMKAGDKLRLGVIRFLRSELKNAEIAKKGPLNEGEAVAIVQRELKRRKEAMLDYEKADRPALVKELKEEIEILSDYLPPQLSEDEIKEMVQSAITELGVFSKKEMGKLMGYLMPKVKGKADGSLVKKIVEELLELNLG